MIEPLYKQTHAEQIPSPADLDIPIFLKRTKEPAMQEPKKTRKRTELPTSIKYGDDMIAIAELTLPQLFEMQAQVKAALADVPRLELEARALRRAIISKA